MAKKDLVGQRFGRLVVVKDSGERDDHGCIIWECKCDCGNITKIRSRSLLAGDTRSCGCYNRDVLIERVNKDGAMPDRIIGGFMNRNNTTGRRGVTRGRRGFYRAQVKYNYCNYHLWHSRDINECIAVREEAEDHVRQGDFLEWYENFKTEREIMKGR